jgi:hypothetical protein
VVVRDTSKTADLLKNLKELESLSVQIGILGKAGSEMLTIAGVHEFGCDIEVTPKMRGFFYYNFGIHLRPETEYIKIPERSYIRTSFDEKQGDIQKKGADLIEMVMEGQMSARSFYEMLGQTCVQTIQDFITSNSVKPKDTAFTIKNKGSSVTLMDSGRLLGAISYEVK